jgi:selenocysteine lyase/cysteine desulfurase
MSPPTTSCAREAASNVTGVIADVSATTALLKRYGALAIWDFAGGGPYLGIDAQVGDGADAIVLSPHKFVGGPAASGVLIVRKDAVLATKPTLPGGGTVAFVSPWAHRYLDDVVAREEAGTPNVIGDIRVALAFLVKEAVGTTFIMERCAKLRRRALDVWRQEDRIDLLGPRDAAALPILSFRIKDGAGGFVHHQLVTRLLSDHFGVQARGGCACAGPYAHRLLGLSRERSDELDQELAGGAELEKPGWTRLNLSYLMDDAKADFVIAAVMQVAREASKMATAYRVDPTTARFSRASQ